MNHTRKHEQQHIDKVFKIYSDAEIAFRGLDTIYKDCNACNAALKSVRDKISKDVDDARKVEKDHLGEEWAWWKKDGVIW